MPASGVILVVEDDAGAREMLEQYLTLCGFRVHTATDGVQAIDIAYRVHPDIILMDLALPRMHGLDATRALKAKPETKDIVIIAFSAFSRDITSDLVRKAGCDDFIEKPIEIDSLRDVVAGWLSRGLPHSGSSGPLAPPVNGSGH
jgi:two-component system, cell cycle response regulator DivK